MTWTTGEVVAGWIFGGLIGFFLGLCAVGLRQYLIDLEESGKDWDNPEKRYEEWQVEFESCRRKGARILGEIKEWEELRAKEELRQEQNDEADEL